MNVIEKIIDKLTSDYEHKYEVTAFEYGEEPGVETVKVYRVDMLAHKETGELKFEKGRQIHTYRSENGFEKKKKFGKGTPFLFDGRETKVYRYDILPEVFEA